jgi:hypothetical protein
MELLRKAIRSRAGGSRKIVAPVAPTFLTFARLMREGTDAYSGKTEFEEAVLDVFSSVRGTTSSDQTGRDLASPGLACASSWFHPPTQIPRMGTILSTSFLGRRWRHDIPPDEVYPVVAAVEDKLQYTWVLGGDGRRYRAGVANTLSLREERVTNFSWWLL